MAIRHVFWLQLWYRRSVGCKACRCQNRLPFYYLTIRISSQISPKSPEFCHFQNYFFCKLLSQFSSSNSWRATLWHFPTQSLSEYCSFLWNCLALVSISPRRDQDETLVRLETETSRLGMWWSSNSNSTTFDICRIVWSFSVECKQSKNFPFIAQNGNCCACAQLVLSSS